MNNNFDVFNFIENKENILSKITTNNENNSEDYAHFVWQCEIVDQKLKKIEEEEGQDKALLALSRQKNAILGFSEEVSYYKDKVKDIINKEGFTNSWYPSWYISIEDAIYNEILGFGGLAEWFEGRSTELANSSSAKSIGDRIYFMINGELVLQPQKMTKERRKQLRRALLLANPEKRENEIYHEVKLQNETRVTIYNEGLAKKDQDCIVYRKPFVQNYTFEEQAERHTIPFEAIPLLKSAVKIGFNVAFIGAVRTAKSTFLATWQSYENRKLEGAMVETEDEIPLHKIMEDAPIMQFVVKDSDLQFLIKKLMRSDADYIIMAEARDGHELNTASKLANKGTRREKITYHIIDPLDFCYDVASEIVTSYGGDLGMQIIKVAKSFHYLFHFIQLADRSKKRLKAIWEIRYDLKKRQITMHQICKYDYENDDWTWAFDLGEDKRDIGHEENPEALKDFERELRALALKYPMEGENTYIPSYDHLIRGGR